MFTFDAVPVAPVPSIDFAGVSVAGTLEPFNVSGPGTGVHPYFQASLGITGSGSPLTITAGQENPGTTTISSDVSAFALTTGAPSLTVKASFSASGLQEFGIMSMASIQSVSIAFIPEPSTYALAGVMGVIGVAGAWWRRNRQLAAM
jgi:hypothetical protein